MIIVNAKIKVVNNEKITIGLEGGLKANGRGKKWRVSCFE